MKKLYIFILLISSTFHSFSQTCNSKTNLVETLQNVTQKPSVFQSTNEIFVMHPLFNKEDREYEYKFKGNLKWQGNSCKITYTSYKQTKGSASKSTVQLRKMFPFHYPLNTLKTFLAEIEFKGWEFSDNLELDKQTFNGYKSIVIGSKDVEKNFKVCLKENQLYAVSCDFANTGISHAANMEETADLWYFKKVEDKLYFDKKITLKAT